MDTQDLRQALDELNLKMRNEAVASNLLSICRSYDLDYDTFSVNMDSFVASIGEDGEKPLTDDIVTKFARFMASR